MQSRPRRPVSASQWLRRSLFALFLAAICGGMGVVGWHGARQIWRHRAVYPAPALKVRPTCDVLVLGGTPAGIAAALAASRRGANVVLVEETSRLGGDITGAMLNMFDVPLPSAEARAAPLGGGIFGEFYRKLGVAFDVEEAQREFETALGAQPNLRVLKNARVQRLIVEEKRLVGAVVRLAGGGEETLAAPAVVDATNDADFAAQGGAGYYIGREIANPDRKMQSAGLLFSVKDVDFEAARAYVSGYKAVSLRRLKRFKHGAAGAIDVRLKKRGALLRLGGASGNYIWERGDIVKDYVPRGADIVVLSLNLGRQMKDESVVINALNIVGVDGLNSASREAARAQASREIPFLLDYLRGRMPGFEKARLHRIAPQLYIRETRHIHGFYALKVEDIRADRAFYDRVALCSYPLDLHPYEKGDANPFGPQRFLYTLPLRALVPRKIDGVFVASRSLSATYSAAGSARVIPINMAAGQAAGEAAVLCAREGISPHQLVNSPSNIAQLQRLLRASGADIGDSLVKPVSVP